MPRPPRHNQVGSCARAMLRHQTRRPVIFAPRESAHAQYPAAVQCIAAGTSAVSGRTFLPSLRVDGVDLQALFQPVEHEGHMVRPIVVAAVNRPAGFGVVVNL
ncbi:MAG: hypothetical protein WCH75_03815 [Candidatus Binatia bacterium]